MTETEQLIASMNFDGDIARDLERYTAEHDILSFSSVSTLFQGEKQTQSLTIYLVKNNSLLSTRRCAHCQRFACKKRLSRCLKVWKKSQRS
jgi:hypothetical protein